MVIFFLLGLLVAAPVLLFYWLVGHWYARVLVFLLAMAVSAFIASQQPGNQSVELFVTAVIYWFASGVPIYVHRFRARHPQY